MRCVLKQLFKSWLFVLFTFTSAMLGVKVFAEQPDHGEMAAAIRSAGLPCRHVKDVKTAGNDMWSVECNSGHFRVIREADGKYSISKRDPDG